MDNKPTNEEVRHRVRAIIVIILGILMMIAMVSSVIIYSNVDSNATAIVSSKKSDNKKEARSSSIRVDPVEVYNAPDNKIMPQDDGTIIIEGKTTPNKKVRLNATGFVNNETGDITGDVEKLVESDKNGHFKFDFSERNTNEGDLINLIYILDSTDSVKVHVADENWRGGQYLTIVRNENIDYEKFRNKHASLVHHTHSSSDSSITIDAEITFE